MKMDGWKLEDEIYEFSLGARPIFRGYVTFREGKLDDEFRPTSGNDPSSTTPRFLNTSKVKDLTTNPSVGVDSYAPLN